MLAKISKLKTFFDPFESPSPWHSVTHRANRMLTTRLIRQAIKKRHFHESPSYGESLEDRIARIAYFVEYGWEDPIHVRIRHANCMILDGNHRYAAAIYRRDKTIDCEVSGDLQNCSLLIGME